MRRVVYYTANHAKTPKFEDAKIVGINKIALEEIKEKSYLPEKRNVALENLKMGLTFC